MKPWQLSRTSFVRHIPVIPILNHRSVTPEAHLPILHSISRWWRFCQYHPYEKYLPVFGTLYFLCNVRSVTISFCTIYWLLLVLTSTRGTQHWLEKKMILNRFLILPSISNGFKGCHIEQKGDSMVRMFLKRSFHDVNFSYNIYRLLKPFTYLTFRKAANHSSKPTQFY